MLSSRGLAELPSATGAATTQLDAFQICIDTGDGSTTLFMLYKTKEGNWYEHDEPADSTEANLRRTAKLAIDRLAIPHD